MSEEHLISSVCSNITPVNLTKPVQNKRHQKQRKQYEIIFLLKKEAF